MNNTENSTNDDVRLMKGNEALAEAAIRAGMDGYFGYPITPQSEVLEYFANECPKRGGVVLQAESELAAINMIYGAAGTGARVMTSSSSPGISLMQEGLSYITSAQLPCLVVNVVRGGPGLGTIQPSQGDYFQATKGGGHGDYHLIVLAPASVQEMADFVFEGFRLAEKYRNPSMILADGALGQMMEKVVLPPAGSLAKRKYDWTTVGKPATRERNIITSLFIQPEKMEQINLNLQAKYEEMKKEVKFEEINTKDADIILVAFGLSARICQKSVDLAREKGIRLGLLRPITLYPYPYDRLRELAAQVEFFLVVEMNAGQMVEDVRLAVEGRKPVYFKGRMGGMIPSPEDIFGEVEAIIEKQSISQD
ncbi:MAG TPA: 3-methyl-2-oxobutanoate dehydrogenase subunit VorB [Ignavibacteriaceae bacterium]|nr:3-methyl-2-oxobutanoate dehydrogenase subunit VorB [Ignavibacteriaceae bacterium]